MLVAPNMVGEQTGLGPRQGVGAGGVATSDSSLRPACFPLLAALLLLGSAVPSSSFLVPQAPFALRSQQQRTTPAYAPRVCSGRLCRALPSIALRQKRHGGTTLLRAMMTDTPLPADPAALQKRLWEAADVLPSLEETQLRLAKTQETGVSDLGFVAKEPISKGDVVISVPMRLLRTWHFCFCCYVIDGCICYSVRMYCETVVSIREMGVTANEAALASVVVQVCSGSEHEGR